MIEKLDAEALGEVPIEESAVALVHERGFIRKTGWRRNQPSQPGLIDEVPARERLHGWASLETLQFTELSNISQIGLECSVILYGSRNKPTRRAGALLPFRARSFPVS